jgi:hypothetical protein
MPPLCRLPLIAPRGDEIGGLDSHGFAALIRREVIQWARVIKQAGIEPE